MLGRYLVEYDIAVRHLRVFILSGEPLRARMATLGSHQLTEAVREASRKVSDVCVDLLANLYNVSPGFSDDPAA